MPAAIPGRIATQIRINETVYKKPSILQFKKVVPPMLKLNIL